MVRMPDKNNENPFTIFSSILKQKPAKQNEDDEKENNTESQCEEEKVKEIIKKRVVKY